MLSVDALEVDGESKGVVEKDGGDDEQEQHPAIRIVLGIAFGVQRTASDTIVSETFGHDCEKSFFVRIIIVRKLKRRAMVWDTKSQPYLVSLQEAIFSRKNVMNNLIQNSGCVLGF